jgi:hypothetical protein
MARDFGKEQNYDEAFKNVHKCYQVGATALRESV